MNILLFVLLPILIVSVYATWVWARNRQPSSVESGVDAFRREMTALSPDAAPVQRRPERGWRRVDMGSLLDQVGPGWAVRR